MTYGTGYRADPAGHQRTPLRAIAHRLAAPFAEVNLTRYAPPILDQGPTGSCVGHATACAVYTALTAAATPLDFIPSPRLIYTLARVLDRDASAPPLVDEGTAPNAAMRAISTFGVAPMVALADRPSDADPATINDEPVLADVEAAASCIIVGEYAVATLDDVRTALTNGYPVTCAVPGGSAAWQDYAGAADIGPVPGAPDDHYVTIVGYDASALLVRNSWGPSWGNAGNARVSLDALSQFSDLVAMHVRRAA